MSAVPSSVRIIGNTRQDATAANIEILKQTLRTFDITGGNKLRTARELHIIDSLSLFPTIKSLDINVFVDIICPAYFDYARVNILLADTFWYSHEWDEIVDRCDFVFVKTRAAEAAFAPLCKHARVVYIGWKGEDASRPSRAAADLSGAPNDCFLYEVPASPFAAAAAAEVIRVWRPDWPHLYVASDPTTLARMGTTVVWDLVNLHQEHVNITRDLNRESDRLSWLRNTCKVHLHITGGTGCSGAARLSMSTGATCIYLADEGTLTETFAVGGIALPSHIEDISGVFLGQMRAADALESSLDDAIKIVRATDFKESRKLVRMEYVRTLKEFRDVAFVEAWKRVEATVKKAAPTREFVPILKESLPSVSIITPTYNRRELFKLAIYNYIATDYPRDKLEWVIVDDSDDAEQVGGLIPAKIADSVNYIRLSERMPLAAKRNLACERAKYDIIVHMDDDDYYPADSVWTRVSALMQSGAGAVTCTMIPMYDLVRSNSAINVPPLWMSMAKRCSEATLAYTREFWRAAPFVDNIAEGEKFLAGRLMQVKELLPSMKIRPESQGIIVSLMHSKNTSGRRIDGADGEPNGSHYGFSDGFFKFLHSLEPATIIYEDAPVRLQAAAAFDKS